MPKITIIEFDGTEHAIAAKSGESLMEAAIGANIPGIDGDCGGSCACGTCHVFVDHNWVRALPGTEEIESEMLNTRPDAQDNSRLACQITLSEALDGLTISLPEMQM